MLILRRFTLSQKRIRIANRGEEKMSLKGVLNRIAWVDLTTGDVKIEEPEDELYTKYLGGYGLGAYYLYTRQKANVDPLGPDSTLGLVTGPLTGTDAITGNRFVAVGKSPKTGGWGDANCGGNFGPALKQAGLDAIFLKGISEKPVYALVEKGKVTLHDAAAYWGRSGLGMVMGSKRIKAVVASATGTVPVAEETKLKALRKQLLDQYYKKGNSLYDLFHNEGTPGVTESAVLTGDAGIKNWAGSADDFSECVNINADAVLALQEKRYACWKCPIACGGHVNVPSGPYAGEGHKPEYETLAAFGSMCLNDNVESICRLNNICNDAGMDTISTGATVAFAMECYENGIITKADTEGIDLTWGNVEAIVKVTEQMARGEGFGGKILGDGVKRAAERIGKGAEAFAMECGGEELPMHDSRCYPGIAATFVADATPGRHTQQGSWQIESQFVPPDLGHPEIADKYDFSGKGQAHRHVSAFGHTISAAGLCMFASGITPAPAVPEYLTFAMGKTFTLEEVLEIGDRIANLRIAFNLREGIRNKEMYRVPPRALGQPPLEGGPTRGVTVDNDVQLGDYYEAMGWNPETGVPKRSVFEQLGLDFAVEVAEP
jgi:aldehyde:ferredoxin oxidoreductase